MKRPFFIFIFLILFYNTFAQKYTYTREKMGSLLNITIYTQDTSGLYDAINSAYTLTDSLIHVFSDYDDESELNIINQAPAKSAISISKHMSTILKISQIAHNYSNGAFDITLGQITKAWRISHKTGKQIHPDTLQWYKKHSGIAQFSLSNDGNTLTKYNRVFRFDLGGIAKGYIADKISEWLRKSGWPMHLVDAGGDMIAGDAPPGSCGWKIGVELPLSDQIAKYVLCIKNQAVATSGTTYQYNVDDDQPRSHIINPKNGKGINKFSNITVISKTAVDADWIATSCAIMGQKSSKIMMKKIKESTLIVTPLQSPAKNKVFGNAITLYQ